MRYDQIQTPCYVIDLERLESNLKVLSRIQEETGCKILLAQKAFSCYGTYPLVARYLSGATASGLFEARLWKECCPEKENHVFSPAFKKEDMEEILGICNHIVFNSIRQLRLYGAMALERGVSVGLRINPEISTQPQEHAIYDPCAPGSRLGTTRKEFQEAIEGEPELLDLLEGLHFHTLCEQDSDDLKVTLDGFEAQFKDYLPRMKWINFGGGHHITRKGYDIDTLKDCIRRMKEGYGLEVYLEPGEAIALNAGYLHTRVLEIQHHEGSMDVAIMDTSAACHMPDVIEMPYRPPLRDSGEVQEKAHAYRLGGPTCLSGDVIGAYSFDRELHEDDILTFEDMAIYSMVKNNTFNGMPLPDIYLKSGEEYSLWKTFSYEDFKSRI